MAGGEVIAEGQVRVGIDAAAAEAGLKKLEGDFRRSMADIDRQRAEAKIGADISELERKEGEVKAKMADLDAQQADPRVKLDDKLAKAELKLLKSELAALGREKITIRADAKQLRDANKEARIASKAQAEMANQYLRSQRAINAVSRAHEKESEAALKTNADVSRLRESYAKLAGEQRRLATQTGRPGGILRTAGERRALERVNAEMALAAHRIRALGGSVDDIDPDLENHQGILGRWAKSLSSVRVQMGFFSATLRQMAGGLIGLGPIITGLVGAAASLIGVLGTGLAGGIAVGSAALGGFALSALGIGLVMKPVITEVKAATAASKAYSDAVLKYGKDSEQARSAQEKLNQTLKGISPSARKAIQGFGEMSTQWNKLTGPARKNIFDAFGQSLKTTQALMPDFARQTNATTKTATEGWNKWMKSLRSPEAKQALNSLMSNFRSSLPGFMEGLASLGAAIGRIGVSASKTLPSLSKGFAKWADGLEAAVGGGDALDRKIERLVTHMRDIGHLAQASGRLLGNFFNLSADSGDDLVRTLTDVFNRWSDIMGTAQGKSSMRQFFAEAADETKNLFAALGNLTQILFQLGRATAPISDGMVKILTVIGDIIQAAAGIPGVSGALKGIGAALAGLFIVSKARAFASAVTDAARAIGLLSGASAAGGLSGAAGGAGGLLGRIFGRGGTAGIARTEAELAALAEAEVGATTASGGLAAALAPSVLLPVAGITAGLAILVTEFGNFEDSWEEATNSFKDTADAIPTALKEATKASYEYSDAQRKQKDAVVSVHDATEKVAKLYKENAPVRQQTAAQIELTQAQRRAAQATHDVGVENARSITSARSVLANAKLRVKAAKEEVEWGAAQRRDNRKNAGFGQVVPGPEIARREAAAKRDLAEANLEVANAQRKVAVNAIPLERAWLNLKPLTRQTQEGLDKLSKTVGAQATSKIGSFINPKDVARVTELGNKLTKLGRGGQVKEIAVKSHGADEATTKLQRLQRQSSKIDGKVATMNLKTNDSGARTKLTQLSRLSQRVTGAKNTIQILANSRNADQAIARIRRNLENTVQKRYEAKLDAIDNSKSKTESAKNRAREYAHGRYSARLEAIDDASRVAHTAKGAADKVAKGRYQAKITANSAQAISSINQVNGALAALDGATATARLVTEHIDKYRTEGSPAGRAAGGRSEYSDLMTAPEYAVVERPSGPSRRISRPTMLTGEEGPQHPEYVIATNPAYRESNQRYLKEAAGELGYEVVPGYKKGRSPGAKKADKAVGSAPYKPGNRKHHKVRQHRFAPDQVEALNTEEARLGNVESAFGAELTQEEQQIAHKKRDAWDFGLLRSYHNREEAIVHRIIDVLVPGIRKAATRAAESAQKALKGPLSKGKISAANKEANSIDRMYDNLELKPKGKDESDQHYNKRKDTYNDQKKELKRQGKLAHAYASRLEKERGEATKQREDANQELKEINQEVVKEHETKLREIGTEQENLTDIEQNPEFAPYYDSTKSEEPTIGEQTASLSAAREQLFNQFASNVIGYGGPAAGTESPNQKGTASAFSTAGAGTSSAFGSAAQVVAAGVPSAGPVAAGLTPSGGGGTVNQVTNNFAAPPPDPHTWTRQQQFELGALS